MIDEPYVEIENLFMHYFAVWNILIFKNSFTISEFYYFSLRSGRKIRSKKLESFTSCALIIK